MWNYFYVETSDGTPLGAPEDVLAALEKAYPDLTYELQLKAPRLHVPPKTLRYFIEWLKTRRLAMKYPQYNGYLERTSLFYFPATSPVRRIECAFIKPSHPDDIGPDVLLEKLLANTGWVKRPFKPRRAIYRIFEFGREATPKADIVRDE